jgi:hypothetical protein
MWLGNPEELELDCALQEDHNTESPQPPCCRVFASRLSCYGSNESELRHLLKRCHKASPLNYASFGTETGREATALAMSERPV